MKTALLPQAMLRTASLLAPGDQRAEWLREWRSELFYIPGREALRFCLGAFPDALWMRRNGPRRMDRGSSLLESPLRCIAFLVALAAASSLLTILMPAPGRTRFSHLTMAELPIGWMMMLPLTCLLLPAAQFATASPRTGHHATPWRVTLRRGCFLALKVALLQPAVFCGFVFMLWALPVLPVAPQLGVCACWFLAYRWALLDQRNRCPVCLRLLVSPVRIGAASRTFLDWYGAESVCSRGHGLLHIPEMPSSYCGTPGWLPLDDSWRALFPGAAEARQR